MKFKKLVHHYKNLVYNQAWYFTGNSDDAADITQDVLLKLWNHLDNVSVRSAKSWLLKVTRHACIDFSRKKREQCFSAYENEAADNSIDHLLIDSDIDPEQFMDKLEFHENISDALAALPEKLRTIVILRDIQDQTYDTIAQTLDIPLNTVKVYLHRGRKLLAKTLRPQAQL
ncbi:RNA polymerase sigma factor [candidate division KSB1 bacterium]|nr:RNA polymerase sigma factor [candidate division KSB1 bacterium]